MSEPFKRWYPDELKARNGAVFTTRYIAETHYDKLIRALVAVCERGDTDHSAKSMYWIASDVLKAAAFEATGDHHRW